jgi:hypothetical protein
VGISEDAPYTVGVEASTRVGCLSAFLISSRRL